MTRAEPARDVAEAVQGCNASFILPPYRWRTTAAGADRAMPVADVTVIIEIVAAADDPWLVQVFKNVSGDYGDWLQARRHARELANEARELGHSVELWDRSTSKRLL